MDHSDTSTASTKHADVSAATILLVDDNQQNLELMEAYLEDLGCTLKSAEGDS
jgi:CheY-like chemotaxis protein